MIRLLVVVIVIVLVIMIVLVGPLAWDLPSLWLNPGELWELYEEARSIMLRSSSRRPALRVDRATELKLPQTSAFLRRTRIIIYYNMVWH